MARQRTNRYGFKNPSTAKKLDKWISSQIKSASKSAAKAKKSRKAKRKRNPSVDVLDIEPVLPFHAGLQIWPDKRRRWDADAAEKRVRRWAEAQEAPTPLYAMAFLWHNPERPELFGSYKLPIADVIHGKLYVIQRALSAAKGRAGQVRGPSGRPLPRREIAEIYRNIKRYQAKAHRGPRATPRYWSRRRNPELSGAALELTLEGVLGSSHREALERLGSQERALYYEGFEETNNLMRARALASLGAAEEVAAAAPAEMPDMQKKTLEDFAEGSEVEGTVVEMSTPLFFMFQRVARKSDEMGVTGPHYAVFLEGEELDPNVEGTVSVPITLTAWDNLSAGVREGMLGNLDRKALNNFVREINDIQSLLDEESGIIDVADTASADLRKVADETFDEVDEWDQLGADMGLDDEEEPSPEDLADIEAGEIDLITDEEFVKTALQDTEALPTSPAVQEIQDADQDIEEEIVEDGEDPVDPSETLGGETIPAVAEILEYIEPWMEGGGWVAPQETDGLSYEEVWAERGEFTFYRPFEGPDGSDMFVVTLVCMNLAAPNWVAGAQAAGELAVGPVYAVFLDAFDTHTEEYYRYSDILTKDAKIIQDPMLDDCSFPVYRSLRSLLATTLVEYLNSQRALSYLNFKKQIPVDKCRPRFPRDRTSNPRGGSYLLPMAYALTSAVGLGASLYDLHRVWKS